MRNFLFFIGIMVMLSCYSGGSGGGSVAPDPVGCDTVWIDTGRIVTDTLRDTIHDSVPYPVVVHDTVFVYDTIIDSIPYHVMVHDTTRDTIERVITRVDSAYFDRELIYPLYVDRESYRILAGYPINSGDSVEYWGFDAFAPDTIIRKNIRGGTYKVIRIDTVYQVVVRR